MTSQSAVGTFFGPARAGEVGQHLVSASLALALLATLLASVAATDRGTTVTPPTPHLIAEADSLHIAVVHVLDAAATAESPDELAPLAALEDAWATLAVVLARFEARQSVTQDTRPPLITAPPASGGAPRDRALARSAAVYVRGALETHDLRSLQRARDLLEMRSG